ncbi:MAG: hypothetical protein ABIG61_17820 [Planctomycetota bacterium]
MKWYNWAGPGNWSDPTKWEPGGLGGGDGTYPGQFDTDDQPQFATGSGDCTLDVSPEFTLYAWLCTVGAHGYDGDFAFGANQVHVATGVYFGSYTGTITADAGAKIFCGTNLVKMNIDSLGAVYPWDLTIEMTGTGDVQCYSLTGGHFIVNTAGTVTAYGDSAGNAYWDSFTKQGAGTYNPNNRPHTIAGDITYTAGNVTTGTAKWTMSDDGTLTWNTLADKLAWFHVNTGVTCTVPGTTYASKFTSAAGSAISGPTKNLYCHTPSGNDMIDIQGTNTANVILYITADRSNSGKVTAGTFTVFGNASTWDLTQTGVISATATTVYCNVAGYTQLLLAADVAYDLGVVTLGGAATKNGYLDLGNGDYAVSMTSLAKGAGATANQLEFGDAIITLTGTIDGTGITCLSDAAAGTHAEVHGGAVQNVSIPITSETLDATASADGLGCGNVWFSGCNGGHQTLGGGFIGSAKAA